MSHAEKQFYPLNIAVLTVSDTRTLAEDTSGQYLVEALQAAGHHLAARELLTDDKYGIRAQVAQWIADKSVQVVLITGGTGFYGRDNTPGMANRTAVFCLPGSTGACKTGWEKVLCEQLDSRTRPCNFYPHLTRADD